MRTRTSNVSEPVTFSSTPVWPLPEIYGRRPVDMNDPTARYRGVDLAYPRSALHDVVMQYPPGTSSGTTHHFMPPWLPAFAVHDGVIVYAGSIGETHTIVVNHENRWATLYSNLEHMFATPSTTSRRNAPVKRGDVLGYVGALHPGFFRCLHFELWRRGDDYHFVDVDPRERMQQWSLLPWTDDRLTPIAPTSSSVAA